MKIKTFNLVIVLLICAISFKGFAQNDQLFKLWPDSILAEANSAKHALYMSEEEKIVVYYTNLVRINPELFSKTFLIEYLDQNDLKKDNEIKELIKELEIRSQMKILKPSETLTATARNLAIDMGTTGRTGHTTSDGKSFKDRMMVVANDYEGVNENCNYGTDKGLVAFMDLLIDRNVPNYGHRKNILDPEMKYIGVAIEPHKRMRYNCVQDFAGQKIDQ
jgi:hypothetical protein